VGFRKWDGNFFIREDRESKFTLIGLFGSRFGGIFGGGVW